MHKLMTPGNDYNFVPEPTKLSIYDFREKGAASATTRSTVRAVQWNIERNYKAEQIVDTLKSLDADIIFIQEIDIFCERSDNRNHFYELAKELQMLGGFACEFEEIKHISRKARDQGGGVHGNAIFTRFDADFRVVLHEPAAFDWERDGWLENEPRKGRRCAPVANVRVPGVEQPVLCYSVHLEVFCGIGQRVAEFSAILDDATKNMEKQPFQLLFGDLNTLGHSLARLSPRYCRDEFRWKSWPYTEAEWWQKYVFSYSVDQGEENTLLPSTFPKDIRKRARNPGFFDPWDLKMDTTLHTHWGLFKGKLDWTLIKGFKVAHKEMGNHDFSASDHKWLVVELEIV